MDFTTVLLWIMIEAILYFWFIFLTIDMFEVNDTIDATEKKNSIDSSCRDRLSISPYGVACQCEVKSFRFFGKLPKTVFY